MTVQKTASLNFCTPPGQRLVLHAFEHNAAVGSAKSEGIAKNRFAQFLHSSGAAFGITRV